ncbi:hypothetical protein [Gracilinema caldarium]|uniref:hypothetical protein n=1 Tax=Gracilinema caldarium TaxID=215591 RepID=UPI0026F340BE|nr:hypothetical protein [Gracilinema caldarium]
MKTKALLTLLLLALTLPAMSSENKSLPMQSENEYGIESGRLYPGDLVLELLAIAEEEAAAAARDAYDAGYKAGRIDGAALWGEEYKKLQAENARLKKRPGWETVLSIGVGALGVGIVIGMVVR